MLVIWAYVLLVAPSSFAALHPSSPCPGIFSYDTNQSENERWYGTVNLSTDESLVGVRIDIGLDRQAEILVSWMGTVTTEDNQRFTILSLNQRLNTGPPIPSRFMVRFNPVKGSPQVQTIRLNGRQICPSASNSGSDLQQSSPQGHLYENSYTTERVTRRPDLNFGDDLTNARPPPPSRTDSYMPPRRPNPSNYHSEDEYSSQETHGSGSQSGSSSYGSQSSGSYGSQVGREPIGSSTYDIHESYNNGKTRKPSVSSSNSTYSRPSSGAESGRPDYTPHNSVPRPSINININKDVTYTVDTPDMNYNSNNDRETSAVHRPGSDRETMNVNNQYPKVTDQSNSGGSDTYGKTTKKPVVINSININIHSGDTDTDMVSGNSLSKPTTKRPTVNNNKNSSTNNRATTRRPPTYTSNPKPNINSGFQNGRPNRNPDTSTESFYQPSYDKTTERYYQNGNKGSDEHHSNNRPQNTGNSEESRPSVVPSSRPSEGGAGDIPRPQTSSGSKNQGGSAAANSNVQCGRVEVNPAPLITHGQNTARGQWPWHIALYRIEGINLSYSCGGSLISAKVVITAAHCVTKAPRDRPLDADILVVQLGKYHLYQFSDDSVQNKQVRDVIVHPRYNSTNYLDDLALLTLSSPAEFTKFVRPVCLWPKHNFNIPSINNKEGTVVGWGYDENNQVTEELKMARMPVVSYVTCLKSYPQFFSQFTAENKTFCAGFRQGTSVCNGDSGGGMVFQMDNVWYLRGLVSITVAKQGLRVCDTNHYVVFTDVANYIDWINQYLS